MGHITLLVAAAALSASPAQSTTRHLPPRSLQQHQVAVNKTEEVGSSAALRKVHYDEPAKLEEQVTEYPMTLPAGLAPEASTMYYETMTNRNYVDPSTYYDRTSRRSDDYYHGCSQYCGFWSKRCLPSPWCCPGNMSQHYPYVATPHFYYYFRPYNAAQIAPQQVVAEQWVANPRLPYANGVFDEVYSQFDAKFAPPAEAIAP
ncbi:MAG: hypothetical protein ACIALR_08785 [Blastopirellula sp. JB062]